MIKISFLGDIMCEKPFLKAAIKRNKDFYSAFAHLQDMLSESDFVVGNLETPIAGKDLGYTKDLYAFNTPSAFLDDLNKLKIDLYLTANNHCLDRGLKGLKNTLEELDKRGMLHTGTARSQEEQQNIFVRQLGDVNCAFFSYNAYINEDKWFKYNSEIHDYNINELIDINLLIKYRENYRKKTIPFYKSRKAIGNLFPKNFEIYLKKKLGYKFKPYVDNEPLSEIQGIFLDSVNKDINRAKQKADLVFVMPHCGGQFNVNPGIRSKEIYNKLLEFGADAVIGSHPHVIQKITLYGNRPCVFSLGNASMSPSSPFIVKSALPEYGLIFHIYIEKKKIIKSSFSIIKSINEPDNYPILKPINELYNELSKEDKANLENEVKAILKRIFEDNKTNIIIQKEYELTNMKKA